MDAFGWGTEEATQRVDLIEYLSDDVEGRREVRPTDAEEDAYSFSHLCLQGMQLRERADGAVEDEVFRMSLSVADRLIPRVS